MFLYHRWMELSLTTRHEIARLFGIVKKGSTEVVGNSIKSDGYFIKDIELALTRDSLQMFLNTDESELSVLFEMMVNKVEGKEPIMPVEIEVEVPVENIQKVEPKVVQAPVTEPVLTPDEVKEITEPFKRKGRPKGTKRINGVWVYPNEIPKN